MKLLLFFVSTVAGTSVECLAEDAACNVGDGDDSALLGLRASVHRHEIDMQVSSLSSSFNAKVQAAAASLPDGITKDLLRSFRICGSCNRFQRVGEKHDGGYQVCADGLQDAGIRSVYSMGVEQHDQFSKDIYELLQAPVHQFDCTVDDMAQNCGDCHFHKVCVGPKGVQELFNKTAWSMPQVLQQTGQADAPDRSLLMKMDIEGGEWPVFGHSDSHEFMKKFDQIIVEFHAFQLTERHASYLKAMKQFEAAGFQVAHLHGNNCCGMFQAGEYSIPKILEVSFVSRGAALPECRTWDANSLDQTNIWSREELPPAKLPA